MEYFSYKGGCSTLHIEAFIKQLLRVISNNIIVLFKLLYHYVQKNKATLSYNKVLCVAI